MQTETSLGEQKEQSISELWDNFKWPNIRIIGALTERGVGTTEKKILEKIKSQNFS